MADIQPSVRKDLIDVVITSRRPISYMADILIEASKDPSTWARHHFIVVYDDADRRNELRNWIADNIDVYTMPQVTICVSRPGYVRNVTALRQQGLEQGINPYVYFQDDDDPLPPGLERRMKMMQTGSWQAIYGLTQTESTRGQIIEEFPIISAGAFRCEPTESIKWFPSYAHPQAALFKRELFSRVPIDDGKRYHSTSCFSFMVRLAHSNEPITFLPDVVRHVKHHTDNDSGIMAKGQVEDLVHDISQWIDYVAEPYKEFQLLVSRHLSMGNITTYREIAAHVESMVEEGSTTLE